MRTALIDSSLLARKSARRFVGLLAELNDVRLFLFKRERISFAASCLDMLFSRPVWCSAART